MCRLHKHSTIYIIYYSLHTQTGLIIPQALPDYGWGTNPR